MQSVTANFEELLQRVRQGRDFGHASFEPVYYLVFHPSEMLDVKRAMPAWRARLGNDGWNVSEFSLADAVRSLCENARQRQIWIKADAAAPLAWQRTNQAISNAIASGPLRDMFADALTKAAESTHGILLVTDLEGLHPYTRIGALEGQLYGHFKVPTIILYPGERTGKTRLRFLGFYPEDGNYRSVHVGG